MAEQFKYLAIKNWNTYQTAKKNAEWIKDYVGQNDDKDMAALSLFERGLLQELRRVRGRTGKNIDNDVTHIASAIHAKVTDRPHLRHAVVTLISRGLLLLTNEQVNPLEERRGEERRGEKEEAKPVSPPADVKPKFQLPGWIEKRTWEDYEQMRRRIGKPMTDRARNLAVDKLASLQNKGHPVVEVLKQSIFNSWQGVFEIKGQANGSTGKTATAERNNRNLEAIVSVALGDSVRGNDVPDSGAVPHGTECVGERQARSVADPEVLAREPVQAKSAANAARAASVHGFGTPKF